MHGYGSSAKPSGMAHFGFGVVKKNMLMMVHPGVSHGTYQTFEYTKATFEQVYEQHDMYAIHPSQNHMHAMLAHV